MADVKIFTNMGVIVADHKNATLESMDVTDNPIMADYASVTCEDGIEREYHGNMLVEVTHERKG